MAIRYYDDILVEKIKRWVSSNENLRVLHPSESKRLFEMTADDSKDQEFKMPLIALSRSNDIELLETNKNLMSFQALTVSATEDATVQLNAIPIRLNYSLDIYTKTADEGDDYVRELLFKLINNTKLIVGIPYNDVNLAHTAYLHVLNTVSDTSDISERIFPGQFTRWTINIEVRDAYLFNCPYRRNWKLIMDDEAELEIYNDTSYKDLIEKESLKVVGDLEDDD